jgi:hypothetical protein
MAHAFRLLLLIACHMLQALLRSRIVSVLRARSISTGAALVARPDPLPANASQPDSQSETGASSPPLLEGEGPPVGHTGGQAVPSLQNARGLSRRTPPGRTPQVGRTARLPALYSRHLVGRGEAPRSRIAGMQEARPGKPRNGSKMARTQGMQLEERLPGFAAPVNSLVVGTGTPLDGGLGHLSHCRQQPRPATS